MLHLYSTNKDNGSMQEVKRRVTYINLLLADELVCTLILI